VADNSFKINKSVTFNPQSGAPANPVDGDFFYDANDQTFAYYHSGSWANFDSVGSLAGQTTLTSAQFTPAYVRNSVIKVTGTAISPLPTIHGIASSFSAKKLTIYNNTDDDINITHESATEPTTNNRIVTPIGASIIIVSGEVAVLMYDVVQNRWLVVSISSGTGALVTATTSVNGIVRLHQASAFPSAPLVLTDGDLDTANGVVGLNASRAAIIAAPTSAVTALTVTGSGSSTAVVVNGSVAGSIAISALGTGGSAGISTTGNGVGVGISATGGSTIPTNFATRTNGAGGSFVGGATDTNGLIVRGGSSSNIGSITLTPSNIGIIGVGSGAGAGANSAGIVGISAATNGTAGVHGIGSDGFDTHGVAGTGKGVGRGGVFVGGTGTPTMANPEYGAGILAMGETGLSNGIVSFGGASSGTYNLSVASFSRSAVVGYGKGFGDGLIGIGGNDGGSSGRGVYCYSTNNAAIHGQSNSASIPTGIFENSGGGDAIRSNNGDIAAPATNNYKFTSSRTRVAFFAPTEFTPITNAEYEASTTTNCIKNSSNANWSFNGILRIPANATLTAIHFLFDCQTAGDICSLHLYKHLYNTSASGYSSTDLVASANESIVGSAVRWVEYDSGNFTSASIPNTTSASGSGYFQCYIGIAIGSGATTRFLGARAIYTYSNLENPN
jgi:hypothetical protein